MSSFLLHYLMDYVFLFIFFPFSCLQAILSDQCLVLWPKGLVMMYCINGYC